MSEALAKNYLSESEFLELEKSSEIRHEYMDGELFSMAGATRKHNLLVSNINRIVGNELIEKDCEIYSSDLLVHLRDDHNVYPDIAIACGDIRTNESETLLYNPVVVFEVLSKSTESRDRGDKLIDYLKLKSLRDYILVSQRRVCVEHYSRQNNDEWTLKIFESLEDQIQLRSIDCIISVRLIYLKLKLPSVSLLEKEQR